jgi:hypothetical protein
MHQTSTARADRTSLVAARFEASLLDQLDDQFRFVQAAEREEGFG